MPVSLTDTAIRNARPRAADYKLADGQGLHLLVRANGAKLWQMRYTFAGRERKASLGAYPTIGLSEARRRRDEARRVLAAGHDPVQAKRRERAEAAIRQSNTFGAVAEEWLGKLAREGRAPATLAKNTWLLAALAGPHLGHRPIAEITPAELLAVLRKVEARGKLETANRLRSIVGTVFRYAVATTRAERDIAADLIGALARTRSTPRAALLEPEAIGELLRRIDAYNGRGVTVFALKLSPLVFLRPVEVRMAEWGEIDWPARVWRVPGERMKRRVAHLVPLSRQALAVLQALRPLTGHSRYLFPATGREARPISENTVRQAILRMGYAKEEMSAHGFRRMASTRLNEAGFNPDWIERQLAHVSDDEVRGAYNAAQWMDGRREMMQWWADALDRWREGPDLIG